MYLPLYIILFLKIIELVSATLKSIVAAELKVHVLQLLLDIDTLNST